MGTATLGVLPRDDLRPPGCRTDILVDTSSTKDNFMTLSSSDYSYSMSWGTKVANNALLNLRPIVAQHRFSLRDAIAQCYRLVGVAAVLLSHEDHEVAASVSYDSTELMWVVINSTPERDPKRLGETHALGMMSYAIFAKRKLGIHAHSTLLNIMFQLFERHAAAYFAAEPDIHPDIAIGLLYDLAYATTAQGTRKTHEAVKSILNELNSIAPTPGRDRIKLDREQLKRRKTVASMGVSGDVYTTVGEHLRPYAHQSDRLERLLVRRGQLVETGARSLTLERVEQSIAQLRGGVSTADAAEDQMSF
jgi:hypothetical protein